MRIRLRKIEIGEAVSECWLAIPQFYSFVVLDVWVLMPNHLHEILWITEGNNSKKSLGQIVGSFKARSASQVLGLSQCHFECHIQKP